MVKNNSNIVIIGLSGESVFLETDHFHRDGETIRATQKVTEPGGKGYNQAVAASVLGSNVTFLTTVGNDEYGKYAIEYLKNKVSWDLAQGTEQRQAGGRRGHQGHRFSPLLLSYLPRDEQRIWELEVH